MNLDNILKCFRWKPEKEYNFTLTKSNNTNLDNSNSNVDISSVFTNINSNLDYMKKRFNIDINSDVIIREFDLNIDNTPYHSFLLFFDGMIDSNLVNNFVLRPLMDNNFFNSSSRIISEQIKNNVVIRKIKKIDLADAIYKTLIPQNNISKETKFDDICSSVNSGNCALFIDTLGIVFNIDIKGFEKRSVQTPTNEIVIKGPQEGFVENIRTNTSLLRRIINSENLLIENIDLGSITKTTCAICYMDNITNDNLVNEVRHRLSNLSVDSIISSRATRRINYRW